METSAVKEQSPLRGETLDSLRDSNTEVLVLLKAFDETFSTIVQTRTSYTYEDVVFGARFADAFMAHAAERFTSQRLSRGKNNRKVAVDMRLFDIIEPVVERLPE